MIEKSLYQHLKAKGFFPKKIAELGVYYPESSSIYEYILEGIETLLVEADPSIVVLIKEYFKNYPNIKLYEYAVFDSVGEIELVISGASSFVSGNSSSPAEINDNVKVDKLEKVKVKSITFDKIDDGNIDLLSIDIEGSEWYVLKYMISRPVVISIETHGGMYLNPFYSKIIQWMNQNNYQIWYKTNSDSVFVQRGIIKIDLSDKIHLILKDFKIKFFRLKKTITRKIKRGFN